MILRPFLYAPTACASYLFGCTSKSRLAVVDPHAELVDRYVEEAACAGSAIVAVFETHVQADHVSGLPELVAATGAIPYLPAGAGVSFASEELADGDRVELGNTLVTTLSTPGHAPAHADAPFPGIRSRRSASSRRHNQALAHADADSFAAALLEDVPPPPAHQAEIVAANREGRLTAVA